MYSLIRSRLGRGVLFALLCLTLFLTACDVAETIDEQVSELATNQPGNGRYNPHPPSDTFKTDNWDISIKRIIRGEDAWIILREANTSNKPPALGKEYILIKYHLRHKRLTGDEERITLDITGDNAVLYRSHGTDLYEPDPYLQTSLEPRTESEGWLAYEIKEDEGNLILVADELFTFDIPPVYFALDEGNHVISDPTLDDLAKTETGSLIIEPALFGEQLTTDDWQIELRDVVYGDEAWDMIFEANKFNDPPPEGMIYLVIKVWARYIGNSEQARHLDEFAFTMIDTDGTKYRPPAIVNPEPEFKAYLFPGGQTEGWIVMEMPADEPDPILIFEPTYESGHDNKRFLSLQGYGR